MAEDQNPFAGIIKMLGDASNMNNIPSLDYWDELVKRNTQAVADAAKVATEGAQAIARRQAEIAQANAADVSKLLKESVSSSKSPEKINVADQIKTVKDSYETSVAQAREIFEMFSKSSNEAASVISNRVSESLTELGKAASGSRAPSAASKKKTAA